MNLRYRTVIFDLDGTLVDSYQALLHAVNHSLESHGRPTLTVAQLKHYVGEGVEPLLARCFEGSVPDGAHDLFLEVYDDVCCDMSEFLADVEETLVALHELGVSMSVCTNKPTSFSEKILESLDAARFFKAIVGPDLAGAKKPDPRHVLRALGPTGNGVETSLFVGDMPIDVQAARAAGLRVAAVATGSADLSALLDAEPDYLLEGFSDLLPLVRGESDA